MNKLITTTLKTLFAIAALSFAVSSASAQEEEKPKKKYEPTPAELEKYDADKDGKLSKTERAALNADKKANKKPKNQE